MLLAGSLGTGRLVGTIVQHWPRSETMCLPWSPRPRPAPTPPPPRLGHLDNGALALITGTLWHWQQSSPVNTPSFVANTITWIVSRQINSMVAWQQIQILKNYSFLKRNIRSISCLARSPASPKLVLSNCHISTSKS